MCDGCIAGKEERGRTPGLDWEGSITCRSSLKQSDTSACLEVQTLMLCSSVFNILLLQSSQARLARVACTPNKEASTAVAKLAASALRHSHSGFRILLAAVA